MKRSTTVRGGIVRSAALLLPWLVILAGCAAPSEETARLERARAVGTEVEWRAYARDFPGSPGAEEAHGFLETRERERQWRSAINLDTIEAYRRFANEYPNSPESILAMKRVNTLLARVTEDAAADLDPPAAEVLPIEIDFSEAMETDPSSRGGSHATDTAEAASEDEDFRLAIREIDEKYAERIRDLDQRVDDKRKYIAELRDRLQIARAERDEMIREAEDLEYEARIQNQIFGANPANPTRSMLAQAQGLRESARFRNEEAADLAARVSAESGALRELQSELSRTIGQRDGEKRALRRKRREGEITPIP